MQAFSDFQQQINHLLDSNSSLADKAIIIKQLENKALNLCSFFRRLHISLLAEDNEPIKNNARRSTKVSSKFEVSKI
jgi:hypothetical protein